MRGSVYRRPDRKGWYYTVDVGPDPVTGKRRQVKRGGFRREKDALAAMGEVLSELRKGEYRQPSMDTVAAYLAAWLESVRPPAGNLRPTTWASYRLILNSYAIPRIGAVPVEKLTPVQLDALYGDLLREGGKGGTPLSRRTVRYVHVVLHRALKDGVRKGLLAKNVADQADPPSSGQRQEFSVWTAEELRTYLEATRGERLYPIWLLAASTGMRRGEILGLGWAEVDLDAAKITVAHALTIDVTGTVQASDVKTAAGRRRISIEPQTVAALRSWRRQQLEERVLWGSTWADTGGLVFTREDGSWIRPDRLSDLFETRVKASGLPVLTFHDLRHTHATLGLKAGIPPKVMQERLGHSSIKITLDLYAHVIEGMDADAAATFGALLSDG